VVAAVVSSGRFDKDLDGVKLFWVGPDSCRNVFHEGWVSGLLLVVLEVKAEEGWFFEWKNLQFHLQQI
jgi:hypothetical protein